MEFRRDASMLNVSVQGTDAGRWGGVGDTGPSLSGGPSRRLALLGIRCLCWGGLRLHLPCPRRAQASGQGTVEPQPCPSLLALQDELSHINARLNMGILGCEYGPAAAPTIPEAPPVPHQLVLSLQPTTRSRSSSAKERSWATRAPSGVSVSTPWGTCSSVAPPTRPSRWLGSCLGGICSLAGLPPMGGAFSPRMAYVLIPTTPPWNLADPAGTHSNSGLYRCGTRVPPTSARRR